MKVLTGLLNLGRLRGFGLSEEEFERFHGVEYRNESKEYLKYMLKNGKRP